jgi:hypothetical protein
MNTAKSSQPFNPLERITQKTAAFAKSSDSFNTRAGDSDPENDFNRTNSDEHNRDLLLQRCRDAIETLHQELSEERAQKHHFQSEVQQLRDQLN